MAKQANALARRARFFERDRTGAFHELNPQQQDNEALARLREVVRNQEERINTLMDMVKELLERPEREVIKELQPIKTSEKDPRVDSVIKQIEEIKSKFVIPKDAPKVTSTLQKDIDELAKIVDVGFKNLESNDERFNERLEDVENTIIKFAGAAEKSVEDGDDSN